MTKFSPFERLYIKTFGQHWRLPISVLVGIIVGSWYHAIVHGVVAPFEIKVLLFIMVGAAALILAEDTRRDIIVKCIHFQLDELDKKTKEWERAVLRRPGSNPLPKTNTKPAPPPNPPKI